MIALKGDFISFSFNGVHSSELGIIRTSDGSRFNENLLPTIQDKTVQVPGGDGTYFFGSYYTQRQFNVPIAFDSLTEEQVRGLYSHFGDKQIHELIFDERPYKYYMAKINGTPQIKTICFDGENGRVYKGEGTLNFICYYPFAKSKFKYLNEYVPKFEELDNIDEWAIASKMKETSQNYDTLGKTSITVFNAGDLPADFKIYFDFGISGSLGIRPSTENANTSSLVFSQIEKNNSNDYYLCFNSKNELIEGCDENYLPTGSVYNKYITGGDFFKIPEENVDYIISAPANIKHIEYEYIYF